MSYLSLVEKQKKLILRENKKADKFKYNHIVDLETYRKFLFFTSIPFVCGDINFDLKDLWPHDCYKCDSTMNRRFFPTGNLKPKIMVIGDAPSFRGGEECFELYNSRDNGRVWVNYKSRTSMILRKALNFLNLHHLCWYTNLLKCSVLDNRPSNMNEINNCFPNLKKEIELLKPKLLLILGNHVNSVFNSMNFNILIKKIYHPSYAVRIGMTYKDYAKHIKEVL